MKLVANTDTNTQTCSTNRYVCPGSTLFYLLIYFQRKNVMFHIDENLGLEIPGVQKEFTVWLIVNFLGL